MLVRSDVELAPYPAKITLCLERWVRAAPDRVCLAQRGPDGAWRTLTYGAALDRVRQIGQALIDRGLSPERGIAILSENSLEHALLGLGAQYVGVPYAPVSTAYSLVSSDFSRLRHVLDLVRPGLVFAANGRRYQRAIEAVVPAGVEAVVAEAPPSRSATMFEDLAAAPSAAVDAAHAKVGPDTVAKLLFTSGSTGLPKGVINTQRMMCSNQAMIAQVLRFLADGPPTLVDWLPWSHTFGGNHNFNMTLFHGGSFYIDEGRPVGEAIKITVQNLREIAPTIYFNVPRGYEALVPFLDGDADLRATFYSRLQALFYAGAGLSPHVWDRLQALAVHARGEPVIFLTSLGSTETAPASLVCNRVVDRPGLIGVPAPGLELKLVPEAGKLELRLRGPNITPGYWREPDKTAAAFDDEGFYRMGDAVRFADAEQPSLGFVFDGRVSEDFKLATGTWVNVGELRAGCLKHMAPLASDVVIAGHERDDVAALIVPNLVACRAALPGLDHTLSDAAFLRHPVLHAKFRALLSEFARHGTGSSNRIVRAVILDEPLSLDAGEITDKGSVNQRAVLTRRAALVEELYAPAPGPAVIVAA